MKLAGRTFEFRTMRARLLTWMMVLLLLPVVLLVVIGLGYAEEQLRQRVVNDMAHTTRVLVRDLDSRVANQLEDNRILARSPYLQQALAEFNAAYDKSQPYSMAYQELEDKYWTYLSYYAEKHDLNDLLLVSPAGDVVFSATQSDLYGQNLNHVDFAGRALRRAYTQALWQMDSVLQVRTGQEQEYAALAAPVVSDHLLGVVIQLPSARVIQRLLVSDDTGTEQNLSLYVSAGDGTFREFSSFATTVSGSALNRLLSSAFIGQDTGGELDNQGTNWLVSLKPLPALNGVIMVRQPKSLALAAVRDLRISATLGSAILVMVLLIAGRRVSGNLTRPLKELASNLEKIGQGQRQLHVSDERADELGMLAREFNHMTESLRSTQAQLVQSEKMASIGHLAAGVAHEINNPMSIVTSNIDTLRQYTDIYVMLVDKYDRYIKAATDGQAQQAGELAEEILRYQKEEDISFVYDDMRNILEDSLSGLGRVKHIVSSLKIFSELDKAQEQTVDLQECLQHVIADMPDSLKNRASITLDVRVRDSVSFKEEQMRRVFAAVADNAVKACEDSDGGGSSGKNSRVNIRAWQNNDQLVIEFSDNGSGMDDECIKRIFDPFFTTRAVGEGLGLGLSVSHSIVEAHGGRIRVLSKSGQGTRVQIILPMQSSRQPAAGAA